MSWEYYDYESAEDSQQAVKKELALRAKQGLKLAPVVPRSPRTLCDTFWGQAWNRNLMAYSDYESRMPRGRSYFRSGKVLGLQLGTGTVTSVVVGKRVYDVSIQISPLSQAFWKALQKRCAGKIGGLVELLSGELSAEVMRAVTDLEHGLFPKDREIQLSCSCPDWAGMCKHCAATLYAVGSMLDDNPRHLFTLRGVDPESLIGKVDSTIEALLEAPQQAQDRSAALEGVDFGDVFGIDLAGEPTVPPAKSPKKRRAPKP